MFTFGGDYWVYMLASRRYGTLYVGVTNSLSRRVAQHRGGETPGFTRTYGVVRLVWFQGFGEVTEAIGFEKRLKRWRREWKIQLIEAENPRWDDLYELLIADPNPPNPNQCHPGRPEGPIRDPYVDGPDLQG